MRRIDNSISSGNGAPIFGGDAVNSLAHSFLAKAANALRSPQYDPRLPAMGPPEAPIRRAVGDTRSAIAVYDTGTGRCLTVAGPGPVAAECLIGGSVGHLVALLPAITPETLGHSSFTAVHGCQHPYVVGEMARGIATAGMVVAAGHAGLLGFFGSAGLDPAEVEDAIDAIRTDIAPGSPWGMNLIHMPDHAAREQDMVELYLRKGVERISASAYLRLSPHLVRLSAAGLSTESDGTVQRKTMIFAKVSRPEIARTFMQPPPHHVLRELAAAGLISSHQAELQSRLPLAEDITVEADSAGHTDNRPLGVIFPVIDRLRQKLTDRHAYARPIRLGAAGGLGTPEAVAASFQLGADYVLTGSINQAAIESGLSNQGRSMLAAAGIADVAMAPAADMFERGVQVQVLRRGTTFHVKARRLHDLYRRHTGLEDVAGEDRQWLEQQIIAGSTEDAWRETRNQVARFNPEVANRAESDPKRQMALVFRRYLFQGAQWARTGSHERRDDYQIWCGPAMGAFNDWVRGSCLEPLENRSVGQIGLNILEGACRSLRVRQLRQAGVTVPAELLHFTPRQLKV